MSTFFQQLQEIQLLQSSLLAGESLSFKGHSNQWEPILNEFNETQEIPAETLLPAHFVIKLQGAPVWVDIKFSDPYPKNTSISIRGDVSKSEQIE